MDVRQTILDLIPKHCPACGAPTLLSENLAHLSCSSKSCSGKLARRIEIYAKTLELKWFGPSVCERLASSFSNIPDLIKPDHSLNPSAKFIAVGISSGVADRMVEEVSKLHSREVEDWRCIAACSPSRVGPTTAQELADNFASISSLLDAPSSKLQQVMERGGEEMSSQVFEGLQEMRIEILETRGLLSSAASSPQDSPEGILLGKAVAVTGSIPGFTRDSMKRFIEQHGGKFASSVSSRTSYLVVEDTSTGTSKVKKAEKFGTQVISGRQLLQLVGDSPTIEMQQPKPEPNSNFDLGGDLL